MKINPTDLWFLIEARWKVVTLLKVQQALRETLRHLPDEVLPDAIKACFIDDLVVVKTATNMFNVTKSDEYADGRYAEVNRGLINGEGQYTGEQLIELIVTGYETLAHLCLCFNSFAQDAQCFPYKEDTFILCNYRR